MFIVLNFLTEDADTCTVSKVSKNKNDILMELFQGQLVGGALSQLANYSDLFLKMSEAVFLLDRNAFRILECNGSALSLLKMSEEEVLGQELPVLFHEKAYLDNKLKTPFDKSEMVYHSPSGDELIFEISATPLKILDYIEVIQFIVRDISAIKHAEREMREMNEALLKLSTTDAMTGLRNYRYFKEVLASVHHQAESFHHDYGIIFIDVDHFKKFNDRNGHPAGDDVLRLVANILKETARSQDLPARYGGEEFVVLCRNSNEAETKLQAEVIRKRIASTAFPFGEFQPLGKVSVSIGVSSFPASGQSPEVVLANSDLALYVSKEAGRNCVTAFSALSDVQKQKKVA